MTKSNDERETRTIEESMTIDAPLDAVWKALTEAKELVRWFPLEAGEKPDGSIWMSWGDGVEFTGNLSESEPPRRARFVYYQPTPGRDPTTLKPEDFVEIATEYRLESEGGRTTLRLVHSGFGADADWDDQFEATRTGWEVELRGLRHYLENHRGRDRLVAWAKAPYGTTRVEAWNRLMGSSGLLAEGSIVGLAEGERYAVTARNGDRFRGIVRWNDPPRNFVATAEDLSNSLLRIRLEDLYGRREVHVWLSAYRLDKEEVTAFEQRWQQELDALFPA